MVRREIPCDDHVSVEPIKVKRQTRRTPEELVNQSLLLIERVGLGYGRNGLLQETRRTPKMHPADFGREPIAG